MITPRDAGTGQQGSWLSVADVFQPGDHYFGSPDADTNTAAYSQYEARRDQIERDFSGELTFQPLPDKKACRIAVYLREADVTNTVDHAGYTQWLMDTHERFRRAIDIDTASDAVETNHAAQT
jgi:hypothetical protein